MAGYVYIMASERNGTLYIGVTSNLEQRVYEHREGLTDGFSKRYGCKLLIWYKEHEDIGSAIQREKTMKQWYRIWKIKLIEDRRICYQDYLITLQIHLISNDQSSYQDYQKTRVAAFLLASDNVAIAIGKMVSSQNIANKIMTNETMEAALEAYAAMVGAMRDDCFESTHLTTEDILAIMPIGEI